MALKQTISLEGLQQIQGELKNLADVGESAFQRIQAAVSGGGGGLEAIAANILNVGKALTSLTGAVTVFAGVTAGLIGLTVSASNAGEEFENLGVALGTTTEDASALISSFARAGADIDGLAQSLRRAAKNITTEWAAVQDSVRQAGTKTIANNLAVEQSMNSVAKASVAAANQEKAAALEREANALGLVDAQTRLDDLLEKRRVRQGGQRDPQLEAERAAAREQQEIAKARLAVAQAEQKAQEAAAQAAQKAREAAIAQETAELALIKAREQRLEDQKNSITNLVGFVNDLQAGITDSGRQVNRTIDNIFKGIVASAGGLDASFGAIEGDISGIASPQVIAVLEKTSDVMKNLSNNTERQALLTKVLGRAAGQEAVAFFSQGSAAIKKYMDDVKRLGLTFTEDMVHATQTFRRQLFTLEDTLSAIKNQIGAVFAPVFGPFFEVLGNLLAKNKGVFVGWANTLADTVKPTLDSIIRVLSGETTIDDKWLLDIIESFKKFGAAIRDIVIPTFQSLVDVIGFVAEKINSAFGTNLDAASLLFVLWAAKVLKVFALVSAGLTVLGGAFAAFGAKAGLGMLPLLLTIGAIVAGLSLMAFSIGATDEEFKALKKQFGDIADLAKKMISNFTGGGAPTFDERFGAVADQTKGTLEDLVKQTDNLAKSGAKAGNEIAAGQKTAQAQIKATGAEVEKLKTGIDATFRQAPGAGQTGLDLLPKAGPLIDLTKPGALAPPTTAAGGQAAADQQSAAMVAAFQTASDKVREIWTALVAFVSDPSKITAAFEPLSDELTDPFFDAADVIETIFDTIAQDAERMAQRIVDAAAKAAQAMQQIQAGAGGGLFLNAPLDLAGGGRVFGPGTWTSDSVPAWLSRDEFVQPATRVMQYGVDFMEAIRRGLLSPDAVRMLMGDLRGFRFGGMAGVPRFAEGGQARSSASTRTLQLLLGGQTFTTTGPAKVIDALEREAALRSISSTGIAQSFVGRR